MPVSKFNTICKHISFSDNVLTEIQETGEEVQEQIAGLDNEASEILHIILNQAVQNIFKVICSLEEIVIKSNSEELSNSNLKFIVKRLSQACNGVVQEYYNNYNVLKSKFGSFVQNLLHESDGLFNVIKRDQLHDYKHELVEALREVLCTITWVKIRNQIQNYNAEQLKNFIEEMLQNYKENLAGIKNTDDEEVLKNIRINLKHDIMHAFELANHINKVASNYDGEIQEEILKAAHSFHVASVDLSLHPEKSKSIKEAVAFLKEDCEKCWGAVAHLMLYIDNEIENKKSANNLRDLVKYIVSVGTTVNGLSGRHIRCNCC